MTALGGGGGGGPGGGGGITSIGGAGGGPGGTPCAAAAEAIATMNKLNGKANLMVLCSRCRRALRC